MNVEFLSETVSSSLFRVVLWSNKEIDGIRIFEPWKSVNWQKYQKVWGFLESKTEITVGSPKLLHCWSLLKSSWTIWFLIEAVIENHGFTWANIQLSSVQLYLSVIDSLKAVCCLGFCRALFWKMIIIMGNNLIWIMEFLGNLGARRDGEKYPDL